MIKKFIKGKVAVFVDVANIFYSQKTLGWNISYEKLKSYFSRECNLSKINAYTATDKNRPKQEKFINMLKRAGFAVRTKPIKQIRIANGVYQWKGNFDIELAMDMVDQNNEYDTAVLLSGDSDFAPAIDRIKSLGKNIIVMSVKGHISKELLNRAKYISLKKIKDEIKMDDVVKENPPNEGERFVTNDNKL